MKIEGENKIMTYRDGEAVVIGLSCPDGCAEVVLSVETAMKLADKLWEHCRIIAGFNQTAVVGNA